jgi:hypothetical protein
VIDVDGARVLFGDGWGLIRASNTEPVLVARYEAKTPERLAEIRGEMEGWLAGEGIGGGDGGALRGGTVRKYGFYGRLTRRECGGRGGTGRGPHPARKTRHPPP